MTLALVLGGAGRVWRDVEAALDLAEFSHVVACNDAAAEWPGELDAAVSLHAEKMGMWMERRARLGHPAPKGVIGHDTAKTSILRMPVCVTEFVPYRFEGQNDTGSSGLFALKVALIDLGYDKAVLCGVPMDSAGGHFFDLKAWGGANSHRRGWNQALPVIKDRARSMSGWTETLLGSPSEEWLTS